MSFSMKSLRVPSGLNAVFIGLFVGISASLTVEDISDTNFEAWHFQNLTDIKSELGEMHFSRVRDDLALFTTPVRKDGKEEESILSKMRQNTAGNKHFILLYEGNQGIPNADGNPAEADDDIVLCGYLTYSILGEVLTVEDVVTKSYDEKGKLLLMGQAKGIVLKNSVTLTEIVLETENNAVFKHQGFHFGKPERIIPPADWEEDQPMDRNLITRHYMKEKPYWREDAYGRCYCPWCIEKQLRLFSPKKRPFVHAPRPSWALIAKNACVCAFCFMTKANAILKMERSIETLIKEYKDDGYKVVLTLSCHVETIGLLVKKMLEDEGTFTIAPEFIIKIRKASGVFKNAVDEYLQRVMCFIKAKLPKGSKGILSAIKTMRSDATKLKKWSIIPSSSLSPRDLLIGIREMLKESKTKKL